MLLKSIGGKNGEYDEQAKAAAKAIAEISINNVDAMNGKLTKTKFLKHQLNVMCA